MPRKVSRFQRLLGTVVVMLCIGVASVRADDLTVSAFAFKRAPAILNEKPFPSGATALEGKAVALLNKNDLTGALTTQREFVSILEASLGRNDYRAVNERSLLIELEAATKLSDIDRISFMVANGKCVEGFARLLVDRDLSDAETLLSKSLEIYKRLLGENTISVATASEYLGFTLLLKGHPVEAKECFLRDVRVTSALLSEDDPERPIALMLAGVACLEANELDEAEKFIRDAASRDRRLFGSQSERYANDLIRFAAVKFRQKQYAEAEALCLQGIAIAAATHSKGPEPQASLTLQLAEVSGELGDLENQERQLQRALALYDESSTAMPESIRQVLDRYVRLLNKLNRQSTAAPFDERLKAINAEIESKKRNIRRNDNAAIKSPFDSPIGPLKH